MNKNEPTTQGITRRELLKRGAVIGGALAWATPVVQVIGMTPALAAHVSDICFCLKTDDDLSLIPLGHSSGECLDPSVESCTDPIPDLLDEFTVTDNGDGSFTIKYPVNCAIQSVTLKCGGGSPNFGGCDSVPCTCLGAVSPDTNDGTSNFYDVFSEDCEEGSISHIEICFSC